MGTGEAYLSTTQTFPGTAQANAAISVPNRPERVLPEGVCKPKGVEWSPQPNKDETSEAGQIQEVRPGMNTCKGTQYYLKLREAPNPEFEGRPQRKRIPRRWLSDYML